MSEPGPKQLPIDQILAEMVEGLQPMLVNLPLFVAIRSGGVWIAEALHQRLGITDPLGHVDISFYRDDFSRLGLHPKVQNSSLPVSIDNRHVVLVDDILHSGRTARAALNELFAWGRPASVLLAVLVDRGNRELPLHADIVGQCLSLDSHEFIKVFPDGRLRYVSSDSKVD